MIGFTCVYLSLMARMAVRLNCHDCALKLYQRVERLRSSGARTAAAIMAQAHVWGLKGDRLRAKAEFQRALDLSPNQAIAHFNLGWLCDQQELLDDARVHFERAVTIRPALDRAWYGIGIVAIKRGDHARARQAFREVVRIDPTNKYGWYQLGMTHFVLGETRELVELKEHVARFNPAIAQMLDHDSTRLKEQLDAGPARNADALAM